MDEYSREQFKKSIDRKLEFVNLLDGILFQRFMARVWGNYIRLLMKHHEAVNTQVSTPDLTRALERAIKEHQPPLVRGRRVKLRYAHMGGHDPLVFVIHGKQVSHLPGHINAT